jgi:hypothetical protein
MIGQIGFEEIQLVNLDAKCEDCAAPIWLFFEIASGSYKLCSDVASQGVWWRLRGSNLQRPCR